MIAEGEGYYFALEGEKSFHIEQRLAKNAPAGFYPGMNRREALQLTINGELYNRIKIAGELQNYGIADETIFWTSITAPHYALKVGEFNAGIPQSKLILAQRRIAGIQAEAKLNTFGISGIASKSGGTPCFEKLRFIGHGPYFLNHTPILKESEKVCLGSSLLLRNRDYQIDYTTGKIYLTPRFLTAQGLESGETGVILKISYESKSIQNSNLEGAQLWYRPTNFLEFRLMGIQETQTDSSLTEKRNSIKNGVGGSTQFTYESVVDIKAEAATQIRKNHLPAKAFSSEGKLNLKEHFQMEGLYENFSPNYVLHGNTGVEPGQERASGKGILYLPFLKSEGSLDLSQYDSDEGSTVKEEEFYLHATSKNLGQYQISSWGRTRETKTSETRSGTHFLHLDGTRTLQSFGIQCGGEYENFVGSIPSDNIEYRIPIFIKVFSNQTTHVTLNTQVESEHLRLRGDSLHQPAQITRNGICGLFDASYPLFDLSATGNYKIGENHFFQGAVESRFSAKTPEEFLSASGSFRDAVERADDTIAIGAENKKERKIWVQGTLTFKPHTSLLFCYMPLLHLKRNLDQGKNSWHEIQHRGEAKISSSTVQWLLNGQLNEEKIAESILSIKREQGGTVGADALFPLGVQSRFQLLFLQGTTSETNPFNPGIRGKKTKQLSANFHPIRPIGSHGSIGLNANWIIFHQTVSSELSDMIDSSMLEHPTVQKEEDLFVFSDKTERRLSLELLWLNNRWEYGITASMLLQTDRDSTDGRKIGNRTTKGFIPNSSISYAITDSSSAHLSLEGSVLSGYREMIKYTAQLDVRMRIKMFEWSTNLFVDFERSPAYSTRNLTLYLDLLIHI